MKEFLDIVTPIVERFAIDEKLISEFVVIEPNRKHLSFFHESLEDVQCRKESKGISFAKHKQKWPKLTTGAARVLGKYASKNIVKLNRDEADRYMQRESFELKEASLEACDGPGYVIVSYLNNPIGVGMLKFGDKLPYLCSLYPKGWKKN